MKLNQKMISISIMLITINIHAMETHDLLTECNQQQSKMMKTKCNKLDGKAYSECERETVKIFLKCENLKSKK